MGLFRSRHTGSNLQQLDSVYRELNLQVQMNGELKARIASMEEQLLHTQQQLARYEADRRTQPLSQLTMLHEELIRLKTETARLISSEPPHTLDKIISRSKAVCTDAFALLSELKTLKTNG